MATTMPTQSFLLARNGYSNPAFSIFTSNSTYSRFCQNNFPTMGKKGKKGKKAAKEPEDPYKDYLRLWMVCDTETSDVRLPVFLPKSFCVLGDVLKCVE